MPTRLIKKDVQIFSGIELTKYVNKSKGTEFETLIEAIIGIGLIAVGLVIKNSMAKAIAESIGIGLEIDAAIKAVKAALDDSDLEDVIDRMEEGDSLKVTTYFYEWSSGSGNHYTWFSEVEYEIV